MNNKTRTLAVLNYQNYDRLPVVHFGYWGETLQKWASQGHISFDLAGNWGDGNEADTAIAKKLGFDYNWFRVTGIDTDLFPSFETEVIKTFPDGSQHLRQSDGTIVLTKPDIVSIPIEIDHLLKDRQSWQEHYLPKLQFNQDRVLASMKNINGTGTTKDDSRTAPLGLYCGSLFGRIRNWLGLEAVSYLFVDDEKLFDEIIYTVAELSFQCTKALLDMGYKFDYAHYWEDICFKNGPLIAPSVFSQKVGPHYKRTSQLLNQYGIELISVDCDGLIDALLPTWFNNGVNTMFPIEVGTWNASIAPWRTQYGKQLRGVGGMNKTVFAYDLKAVDAEIERLKPLVAMGGYVPCPDHRIAPDAKWENVQYYCEKLRKI